MIKIHSSPVAAALHVLKSALESNGIACEVRGEYLTSVAGEVPAHECWAELWLVDPSHKEMALQVIKSASKPSTGVP